MNTGLLIGYNQLLEGIAHELDIPASKYQIAVKRYLSVGEWLEDGDYRDSIGETLIYPQGSFRLGTVVRPLKEGKESDYDIDLVCQLMIDKEKTSAEEIKTMVGNRLKENADYSRMLDVEKKRCWTLNYAEQDGLGFHIDILPSIPEEGIVIDELVAMGIENEMAETSIAITNKDDNGVYDWSSSNPKGYALWFDQKNEVMFNTVIAQQKLALFENNRFIFGAVEDVPDQLVKTPLQRAIQILKRHRDTRYSGKENEKDKPISMIITTLAAQLYNNEADVYTALKNILERLHDYADLQYPDYSQNEILKDLKLITKKSDGTWWIPNPVNPNENFADKWHENGDRKARAFFEWVSWAYSDLIDLIRDLTWNQNDWNRLSTLLSSRFGKPIIERSSLGIAIPSIVTSDLRHHKDSSITLNEPPKPWGSS